MKTVQNKSIKVHETIRVGVCLSVRTAGTVLFLIAPATFLKGWHQDHAPFNFETELVNFFENLGDEGNTAVWAYSELMGVNGYTHCKILDDIDKVLNIDIDASDPAQRIPWMKGIAGIVSLLNRS